MTNEQKEIILEAWDYCDEEDKSTEFMLQYMADISGLDYDDIVDYLGSKQSIEDRYEKYKGTHFGDTLLESLNSERFK